MGTDSLAAEPTSFAAEPTSQDIEFIAECDDSAQRYVLLLPAEFKADQPHDLLIMLHGHGSDRWQFIKDARDECRAARDAAAEFNMIAISPDYRAATSWMGPRAEADMVQIIAALKRQFHIDKVIASGGSMGGTAALILAARQPKLIDGVVSMNGTANLLEYPNFLDAIAESYGGTKQQRVEEYKSRSAEYWPERLTMPMALTTGGQDTLVPPDSVLRLAAVLKQLDRPVKLWHRPDGGHNTPYDDAQAAFRFVMTKRD